MEITQRTKRQLPGRDSRPLKLVIDVRRKQTRLKTWALRVAVLNHSTK